MTKISKSTPKSIRTRMAIQAAARELFLIKGFDGTTVRDIAARADIDPSMIIRYFGNKEALFALVASPDLRLPDLAGVNPSTIGVTLVRHFLDLWEGETSGGGLPVLLRSAVSNDNAAEQLRFLFHRQVFPTIALLGPPKTAAARAGLVSSQLLGIAITRYVLRLPPVVGMTVEEIVKNVGATIQRYANGPFEE